VFTTGPARTSREKALPRASPDALVQPLDTRLLTANLTEVSRRSRGRARRRAIRSGRLRFRNRCSREVERRLNGLGHDGVRHANAVRHVGHRDDERNDVAETGLVFPEGLFERENGVLIERLREDHAVLGLVRPPRILDGSHPQTDGERVGDNAVERIGARRDADADPPRFAALERAEEESPRIARGGLDRAAGRILENDVDTLGPSRRIRRLDLDGIRIAAVVEDIVLENDPAGAEARARARNVVGASSPEGEPRVFRRTEV